MRLLVHICCGPCALYPIKKMAGELNDRPLLGKKFDKITGFYYNPNIHPPSEYKRRKAALESASARIGFDVVYPPYKMEDYFRKVLGRENSPERCELCWEMRLSETADFAKKNGFDAFTTTLLISPYQDHEKIKKIGERLAAEKGIRFYYQDFRPGFRESQEEAKKGDMYKQKYCGCVFSELERVK